MTAQEQLGRLATVRVRLDIEMGHTEMSVGELLQLRPGSVFTLPAGPATDLVVKIGGVKIGECEPVLLEQKTGVRITRIVCLEEPL